MSQVADEMQNASLEELKMLSTRHGGGKLVLAGDPSQRDVHGPSALEELEESLRLEPRLGIQCLPV